MNARGLPPFFHRGRLSGPSTTSLVNRTGIVSPARVLAADQDQVADAALGELALDRRHPRPAGPAVGPGRVQEDRPSSAPICRRRSLPHLYSTIR